MRLRNLWFPIILLAAAGCGGGDDVKLEKGPFLFVDRDSLGFDQEFGTGTYIGASTFNALYISNHGDQPLELSDVVPALPAEFTLQKPDLPHTLQSREAITFQVQFTPTKEQVYSGKFTLVSNALNTPQKDIAVSGKGVKPPPSP